MAETKPPRERTDSVLCEGRRALSECSGTQRWPGGVEDGGRSTEQREQIGLQRLLRHFPRHEARELARYGRQRPCRSLC